MEASGNQSWFLSKHSDGSVFGPLTSEQMCRWADSAQTHRTTKSHTIR